MTVAGSDAIENYNVSDYKTRRGGKVVVTGSMRQVNIFSLIYPKKIAASATSRFYSVLLSDFTPNCDIARRESFP